MELLFESRLEISRLIGKVFPIQGQPTFMQEPLLEGNSCIDKAGMNVGTVLYDKGLYRMWYRPWTENWSGQEASDLVCYAESDNGLDWKKPEINLVDYHGLPNNFCNLPFESTTVFIDPGASSEYRYRATGFVRNSHTNNKNQIISRGYNTAHSNDGLNWIVDPRPDWPQQDVICSIHHPARQCGIVSMKHVPRVGGVIRRSIWTAELNEKNATKGKCALIPDNFDDVCAMSAGFVSSDYYGMAMMAAEKGTVGFLWKFHHSYPKTQGSDKGHNGYGLYGAVDVSLVYQPGQGEMWIHPFGRPSFISHNEAPEWASQCIYTASCPLEKGDEHWLYFTGSNKTHGWYADEKWNIDSKLLKTYLSEGVSKIGLLKWPKHRLFGFRSDPDGEIDIDLGIITEPSEIILNLKTENKGYIKAALMQDGQCIKGYAIDDSIVLSGNHIETTVLWNKGSLIIPTKTEVTIRLFMHRATVFAYKVINKHQ